jgi:hypothetical protein
MGKQLTGWNLFCVPARILLKQVALGADYARGIGKDTKPSDLLSEFRSTGTTHATDPGTVPDL